MLKIVKYKIILFTWTLVGFLVCGLGISLGVLEIYSDIRFHLKDKTREDDLYTPKKFYGLCIFLFVNVLLIFHLGFIATYALRGFRYKWYIGCNYFLFVLWELISGLVVVVQYPYLNYPVGLSILTGILLVVMFVVTLYTQKIFEEVERHYCKDDPNVLKIVQKRPRQGKCVIIPLHKDANYGASTSRRGKAPPGSQSKWPSTISAVSADVSIKPSITSNK